MLKRFVAVLALPLGLYADFSYQSTSRITGGSLIQMMRFVPGGGAMKEPQVSTVAMKGDRLVHRNKRTAEIIDLEKRTITTVNFDKRTYSEMTFEQMKQMMEQLSAQKPADQKVNVDLDADIKNTGQTKTVNGFEAHEMVLTMSLAASDPQSGQAGAMKINSDMWLAKDVPGAREMREFYTRMAKELDWVPTGMGGMMNRPDINRAMAKMMAEGEKMEGTPVQQVMRMSMDGVGGSGDAGGQTSNQQAAPARPSVGDVLGGRLGGLSGLGGFGKKKKDAAAAPADDSAAPANAGGGSLMEMTMDSTGFSTSPVDASLFVIPGDFKKVEEPTPGRRK